MSDFFDLEVNEIRNPNVYHTIKVRWFTTIGTVKDQISCKTNYPSKSIRLFHPSFTGPLRNDFTVRQLGFGVDMIKKPTLLLLLEFKSSQHLLQPLTRVQLDKQCRDMIRDVKSGLNAASGPSKTDFLDCTGGVYFLRDGFGNLTAVFKPRDEEQGMPNNPKGHAGNGKHGLRENFKPGKGFIREMAAYLMDVDHFCNVPATAVIHCEHPSFHYPNPHNSARPGQVFPKLGSLQKFVHASDIFEDISPSLIGVLELQKIALLDMRLLNCDRNSANILVHRKQYHNSMHPSSKSRSSSVVSLNDDCVEYDDMNYFLTEESLETSSGSDMYELIPIDHGYCLPLKLLIDEFDWVWFSCKQIAQPVHPAIREYMLSIDIENVINDIRNQLSVPEESLVLIRIVHYLIVGGISQGLTLKDIAGLIARQDFGVPSPLEMALMSSEDNAFRTIEARNSFHEVPSPHDVVNGLFLSSLVTDNSLRTIQSLGSSSNRFGLFVDHALNEGYDGDLTASEASSVEPLTSPSQSFNEPIRRFSPPLATNDFLGLETITSEPLKSEAILMPRDRTLSCYTSEEDSDSQRDSLASSPSDCYMLDSLNLPFSGVPLIGMPRVASFGAFDSPAIYELDDKTDRHLQLLRKERRKRLSKTQEFQNMKIHFVHEAIDSLLLKRFFSK